MMLLIGKNILSTIDYRPLTNDQRPATSAKQFCAGGLLSIAHGRSKGVTLIEVLLAVVVLSIGIAGVLQAYGACLSTLETSQYVVNEIELLKEKMAAVEEDSLINGGISPGTFSGKFQGGWKDYSWESHTQTTPDDGLYELVLTVTSPYVGESDSSVLRQLSLATYALDKNYKK